MTQNKTAYALGMYSAFNAWDALPHKNKNQSLVIDVEPLSPKRAQRIRNEIIQKKRRKTKT